MSTDDAEIQKRRIFVGGLFPSITAGDITDKFSKFGSISSVEIKVRKSDCDTPDKTFAYVDFQSTKGNWQKCLNTFNRTKWKGSELKLELAKSCFLQKLEEERTKEEESPPQKPSNSHLHNPLQNLANPNTFELRGAVPGTLIPGEDWVVSKYGRILPILHMKKDGKYKLVTTDPSKYCHNLKKLKHEDMKNTSAADLTWEITHSDSAVTKKRKGQFESWTPRKKTHTDENYFLLKKFYDKRLEQSKSGVVAESDSDEFEVVKASSKVDDDDEDSVGSADTDEIIATIKSTNQQSDCKSRRHSSVDLREWKAGDITTNKSSKSFTHSLIEKMSTNSVAEKMSRSLSSRYTSDSPSSKLCVQNSAVKTSDVSFKNRYNSDSSSSTSESDVGDSDTDDSNPVPMKGNKNQGSVLKTKLTSSSCAAGVNKLEPSIAKQVKCSKLYNTQQEKSVCLSLTSTNRNSSQTSTNLEGNTSRLPEFKGLSMLSGDAEDKNITTESMEKSDNICRKVNKSIDRRSDFSGVGNSLTRTRTDISDSESVSSTNTDEIISNAKKSFNAKCLENNNKTLNECRAELSISGNVPTSHKKTIKDDDDYFTKLDKLVSRTDKKIMSSTPKPVVTERNKTLGLSSDESDTSSSDSKSAENTSTDSPRKTKMLKADKLSSKSAENTSTMSPSSDSPHKTKMLKTDKQLSKSTENTSTMSSSSDSPHKTKLSKSSALKSEKKLLNDSKTIRVKVNDSANKLTKSSKMSDKKHAEDNQKRLLSVMERQKENLMQKAILKKALSSVDGVSSSNKKIVFDSDDDTNPPSIAEPSLAESKTNHSKKHKMINTGASLFDNVDKTADDDDDDDDVDDMFCVRKQYEGKSGRKLMSLQSRIGSDKRFRLDERFADSEEENADVLNADENVGESETAHSLKILESVIGPEKLAHLRKLDSKKKQFKDIAAIRFDPTREDHSQFEIKRADTEIQKNVNKSEKHKKKSKNNVEDVVEEDLPVVDETRHFQVSTSLKDAFKKSESQTKSTFSLLSEFGVHKSDSESSDADTPIKTSQSQLPWKSNVNFDEEMLSGSDMDQDEPSTTTINSKPATSRVVFPVKKWTFFFAADDERLKEGVQYFHRPADYESVVQAWREKRPELVDEYKLKYKRAIRKLRSKQMQYRK